MAAMTGARRKRAGRRTTSSGPAEGGGKPERGGVKAAASSSSRLKRWSVSSMTCAGVCWVGSEDDPVQKEKKACGSNKTPTYNFKRTHFMHVGMKLALKLAVMGLKAARIPGAPKSPACCRPNPKDWGGIPSLRSPSRPARPHTQEGLPAIPEPCDKPEPSAVRSLLHTLPSP